MGHGAWGMGNWLSVICYWLLAICYWLLAICYWLLAISQQSTVNNAQCPVWPMPNALFGQ
jgi:hypothetical protein